MASARSRNETQVNGMGLRAKLLSGYTVFIAALVLLGAWSAWRLHDMGRVSRRWWDSRLLGQGRRCDGSSSKILIRIGFRLQRIGPWEVLITI